MSHYEIIGLVILGAFWAKVLYDDRKQPYSLIGRLTKRKPK